MISIPQPNVQPEDDDFASIGLAAALAGERLKRGYITETEAAEELRRLTRWIQDRRSSDGR